MDELKTNEIELYKNIINWGVNNNYEISFDADSNIKVYQHIEINFEIKKIKIS
jgi:hypothetical protein